MIGICASVSSILAAGGLSANIAGMPIQSGHAIESQDSSLQETNRVAPHVEVQHSPGELTTEYHPEFVNVRNPFLPAEVTPDDIDQYARLLQLSEEQRVFLDRLFATHQTEYAQLRDARLMAIWDFAAELGGDTSVLFDPESARRHSSLYDKRDAYARSMMAIDERMFSGLEPVLTGDQLERLERVRLLRERAYHPLAGPRTYVARADLFEIVDDLSQREDFFATDEAGFLAELLAYERQFTTMRRRYWNAKRQIMSRGVELLAMRASSNNDEEKQALRASRNALIRAVGRAEIALGELHEQSVDRLAMHLPEDAAEQLRSRYLRAAHPLAYPDHHEIDAVLDAAMALDGLDEAQREAVESVVVEYTFEQQRLTGEMKRIAAEYYEKHALTWGSGPDSDAAFESEINQRRIRREALAASTLDDLIALLRSESGALPESVDSAIDSYHTRLANLPPRYADPTRVRTPLRHRSKRE